jgi:hypothetical protein
MPDPDSKPRKIGWIEAWSRVYLRYPSVFILIVANLVPLYGVLFWGWDRFTLMVAYWMETGVIGFWAIIHMTMLARWAAIFYVPFFIVHFGGFMAGHFFFLWAMFAPDWAKGIASIEDFVRVLLIGKGLWIALAALFISHSLSFFFNVLRPWWRGEGRDGDAGSAMGATYGRVVILHLTILFGAALAAIFKTKVAAFVLLIAIKIFVDVSAHIRKNFKPVDGGARRPQGT